MKIKNLKVFGTSLALSGVMLCNTGLSVSASNYTSDERFISSIYISNDDEGNEMSATSIKKVNDSNKISSISYGEPVYISNVSDDYTDGVKCDVKYKKVLVKKEILEDGTISTEYKIIPVYEFNPADKTKKISSVSYEKPVTISNVNYDYVDGVVCNLTYKKVLVKKEVLEDGTISTEYKVVPVYNISKAEDLEKNNVKIKKR